MTPATLALAFALGVAGTAPVGHVPAAPDDRAILVSTDGTDYSAAPASLFLPTPTLVPGTSRVARVHLRNGHPDRAVLTVGLGHLSVSSVAFAETLTLETSTHIGPPGPGAHHPPAFPAGPADATVPLHTATPELPLTPPLTLAPGEEATMLLRVTMADVSGDVAQGERMQFTLRAALRSPHGDEDVIEVPAFPPAPEPGPPGPDGLQQTGFGLLQSGSLVAAGALVTGVVLLCRASRRGRNDERATSS